MATTNVMMKRAARNTLNAVFADAAKTPEKVARRGNATRTMAYVPVGHQHYAALAARMKAPTEGREVAGVLVVECLVPHQDGLSVTGLYLHGSDDFAPHTELVWVAAKDGKPDLDDLCRDGGKAAKATAGAWA